ncbi:MAG: hypothetical protein P4M01_08020 [Acidobacteriota bacterium]|nr:hypothetical protein [Acidobacteriota bacterium]
MQVFLDCDGVLADFESAARRVAGRVPRSGGSRDEVAAVWAKIGRAPDFFYHLEKLPDADVLVEGVIAMGFQPVILTGLPRFMDAAEQKVRWAERHYPGVKMITCSARLKSLHGKPGDVLIDDWDRFRPEWERMGGVFIHHSSAEESLHELRLHVRQNSGPAHGR